MSNYDYEPTEAEIEQQIKSNRLAYENWNKMLRKLYDLTPNSRLSDRHFDAKLEEVRDLVKSRMFDLKEK